MRAEVTFHRPATSVSDQPLGDKGRGSCSWSPDLWAVLALVALVAAVYCPTWQFAFVNWDDPWYVVNNPLIRSWNLSNLGQVATKVVTRNYAPATISSYLVDHTLWGLNAGGYHFTNTALHALNAVLVYLLMAQLTRSRFVGWTTAALFAIHPVQIETVAWISSRKGLLSGAFILATLICWLRPQRTRKQEVMGLAFFALALLSKAIAVVVPAIVLLYDVLICKERFWAALRRQMIPGLLALWLLLLTMSAQTTIVGGVRSHFALSKAQILAVDSVILWRYVGMLFWPNDLCVLYDPPTQGIAGWSLLTALGWAIVGVLLFRCRVQRPLITLAGATFFVLLLPVLNLFPITTLMNDRYLYLPSIPAFALVAGTVERVCSMLVSLAVAARDRRLCSQRSKNPQSTRGRMSWRRMAEWAKGIGQKTHPARLASGLAWGFAATVVLLYAQMTREHLPVWRDDRSLWEQTIKHVPQLSVVRIQLAIALHRAGEDGEAVSLLEDTLANCSPDTGDRKRILEKIGQWGN